MSRATREMITRKIMVHDTYPRMSDAVASAGTSLVVSLAGRRGYTVKFQSQLFSNGILNCKKAPDIIKLLNSTEKQKQINAVAILVKTIETQKTTGIHSISVPCGQV